MLRGGDELARYRVEAVVVRHNGEAAPGDQSVRLARVDTACGRRATLARDGRRCTVTNLRYSQMSPLSVYVVDDKGNDFFGRP